MINPTTEVRPRNLNLNYFTSLLQPFTLTRYHWLVVLLAYTLLSIIVTFPLIFYLNTTVIGPLAGGDNLQNVWDLWWFKHALENGHNPNYTNYLFGQLPKSQIFVWTFSNAIVAWPLQFFLSLIAIYNLLIFFSFVLGGFCMYLLAGLFLKNKFACFVAGFLFDFSTYHFARAAGHLGLDTIEVLPFCAWSVFFFYRKPSLKRAIVAGIGLALVPLTDAYYLAYFSIPFGLLFFTGSLVADFNWFRVRRNLLLGILALGIALVLAAPMLFSFAIVDPSVQQAANTLADTTTQQLSADLLAYVTPHFSNPLFGSLTLPIYQKMQMIGEKELFFGYGTILLVLGTFLFRRNRNKITLFWLIVAAITLVLSLGPKLYVGGQLEWSLPFYKLLYGWSALTTFRAPARMAPVPLMALTLLAGFTVDSLLQQPFALKIKGKVLLHVGLNVLMAFELAQSIIFSFPYPSAAVSMPSLYNQIAADREDGLVLDLPPFHSIGGYMYYQIFHGKRLVTGYPPRITDEMFNSVISIPYILPFVDFSLIKTATKTPTDIFLNIKDSDLFRNGLRDRHITYVILHNQPEISASDYDWMVSFLNQNLGSPFYSNDTGKLMAWHIETKPQTALSSNLQISIGSGWLAQQVSQDDAAERIVSQNGQIIVELPEAKTITLNFKALSYFQPLTMKVLVNDKLENTTQLDKPFVGKEVKLTNLNLKAGKNIIEIESVQGCAQPRQFDKNNLDPRCFSFGIQNVLLEEAQK